MTIYAKGAEWAHPAPTRREKKRKKRPSKAKPKPAIGSQCTNGRHTICFVLSCQCECHKAVK